MHAVHSLGEKKPVKNVNRLLYTTVQTVHSYTVGGSPFAGF